MMGEALKTLFRRPQYGAPGKTLEDMITCWWKSTQRRDLRMKSGRQGLHSP